MGKSGINQVTKWYGISNRTSPVEHREYPGSPAIMSRQLVADGKYDLPSISMGSVSADQPFSD